MLLRCRDHGPDVIGAGLRNPTLAYNDEKYCKAFVTVSQIPCPEDGCPNAAFAWLTFDEVEAWENGQEVLQLDSGESVELFFEHWLGPYVDVEDDDFELC